MSLLWLHSSSLGCASKHPTMILSKYWIFFELWLNRAQLHYQVVFWASLFGFTNLLARFFCLTKVITTSWSWINSGDFIGRACVLARSPQIAVENCCYMICGHARCSQRCLIAFAYFEIFGRGCFVCLQLFRSLDRSHDVWSLGRRIRWKWEVIRSYLS